MKPRFFSMWERRDFAVGLGCGLAAFLVYFWTTAPNVTLLDSGEFLVASGHFGVPHPTGYPLWTILCGLFQHLPLGNLAWKGNLFSGVCGGLAVGLAAALLHQSSGWLFREFAAERGVGSRTFDGIRVLVSVVASLTFAFSVSMWSQAVITEVYTLHALLVLLYLTSIYCWIHNPQRTGGLVASVFFWALGMSNHHLVLVLLPLTVLFVLLLRRDIFLDFIIFLSAAGALVLLAFSSLSDEPQTPATARRFAWCVAGVLLILAWVRKGKVKWRLLPGLLFAVVLGFLPYLYMPLASSTNPPMNWGYTRDADGLYFSINRSQYTGRLSDLIDGTLGRLLGSEPVSTGEPPPELPGLQETSRLGAMNLFAGFFWIQLTRNFTPLLMLSFFVALLAILYLAPPARAWILLLYVSFILAGFFEPFFSKAKIDQAGWLLQMPYHTYSFALFALVSGTGMVFAVLWLLGRRPFSPKWLGVMLAIPFYVLYTNADFCSQRGKWFGWEFGHEMLKDMPRGSVLFGGTDPGRFVPTYMIFSESFEPASHKRDPGFDRRDLYIITQNALVDNFYWRYIRDHYGPGRPAAKNAFERWLGRDKAYPGETLIFPTEKEIKDMIKEGLKEEARPGGTPATAASLNGPIAQWIFEKNKDRHTFFVEESFSMPWSYSYAVPEGLIYRLNPVPLAEIPAEAVKKDRAFWTAYSKRLLEDPVFRRDIDAQRSFSKLRTTTGNIYRFRQKEAAKAGKTALASAMLDEAVLAYRQALDLWKVNPEAVQGLLDIMTEQGKTAEALELIDKVFALDPFNNELFRFSQIAYLRDKLQVEIRKWETRRKEDPKDSTAILKLLELYLQLQDTKAIGQVIEGAMKTHSEDRKVMQVSIATCLQSGQEAQALQLARRWEKIEPKNERVAYLVSRLVYLQEGNKDELRKAVRRALELGGEGMKEEYRRDPVFAPLRKGGALDALLDAQDSGGKAPLSGKTTPAR